MLDASNERVEISITCDVEHQIEEAVVFEAKVELDYVRVITGMQDVSLIQHMLDLFIFDQLLFVQYLKSWVGENRKEEKLLLFDWLFN